MTLHQPHWDFPHASTRLPLLAANAVATSQPLAAQAGVRMLLQGGNAVDAALAAAITLSVVEPVMNGIGGDAFALIWHEGSLQGLNATGRAPAAWERAHFDRYDKMPSLGWDTVTVPGQVAGWIALSRRYGKLPFAKLFEPAIHYAEHGFPVSPTIARQWADQAPRFKGQPGYEDAFTPNGATPRVGEIWRFPAQARTLALIAETEGEAFYRGELAEQMVAFAAKTGGALSREDLAAHQVEWVKPISMSYGDGYALHEIPPNGQGIAALMALGMLDTLGFDPTDGNAPDFYHLPIEAMKLAFSDLYAHVAEPGHMRVSTEELLSREYLAARARLIDPQWASVPAAGTPSTGGTVYLSAADASGMMVSFIQSNYHGFGSGVVVPDTGISLHNRGENFTLTRGHPNEVGPGKRPMHTIIPGFITHHGKALASMGVMGGAMQAQGHLQMMLRLAGLRQNPQAAIDAARFRVEAGRHVKLEAHTPAAVLDTLRARGHEIDLARPDSLDFGAAQVIQTLGNGSYIAASDPRRDGQAAGF